MTIRIAMWSGPRNLSTAMMRSFENRSDCVVSDEPFYAAYLAQTGLQDHPMTAEVLASQPNDWRDVVAQITGPAADHAPIWYQKHMTHHMLPGVGRDWLGECRNAFLIRRPDRVIASYIAKREDVTLADIGAVQQRELFDAEADRLGRAPPVIDAADVLANPEAVLFQLCEALGIDFSPRMLSWPAGRRASDGAWAPAWYASVEASTGFGPPADESVTPDLPPYLQGLADQAMVHYKALAGFRLQG